MFTILAGSGVLQIVGPANSPSKCGRSQQAAYQCAIIQDRQALQPGYISLPRDIPIHLRQPYVLVVTACGDKVRTCRGSGAAVGPIEPEPEEFQGRVKAGAYLKATLTGDIPADSIQSQSPDVQPVITATDSATWAWEIDPSRAGVFELRLTMTPMLADTNTPLTAGVSFPIKMTVSADVGQQIQAFFEPFWNALKNFSAVQAGLGFSIATAVAWFYRRRKKKLKKAASPATSTPAESTLSKPGTPDPPGLAEADGHDHRAHNSSAPIHDNHD